MHADLFARRFLKRFASGLPTCHDCAGTGLDIDFGGSWRVRLCEPCAGSGLALELGGMG